MPRIAVIAMGRWGGREMSYSSDADAMFVMEDANNGDSDPTKVATCGDQRDADLADLDPAPIRRSSIDADLTAGG